MKTLLADIETRSRADLKKVGQRRYALDPSTQVTTAVWKWKGDNVKHSACAVFPRLGSRDMGDFLSAIEQCDRVVFHNAGFDVSVLESVYKIKIPADKIDCTMARAQRMSYPAGLDQLCISLGINGKLDGGRALVMATCKPRPDGTFLGDQKTAQEQNIFRSLLMYNMGDVDPLEKLDEMLPPLSPSERIIWERTWRKNMIGLPIDLRLAEAVANRRVQIENEVSAELKRLTATPDCPGGMVDKVTQRVRIMNWFAFMECPLKDTRKDTIDEMLDDVGDKVAPQIIRVLQILKESGGTAPTKAATLLERHVNGWYLDATRYFGARSGRGTSEGVNAFNIARPSNKYDVAHLVEELRNGRGDNFDNVALSDSLRGLICAPSGWHVVDCDEMQGELRVQLWLSGDQERLNILTSGGDLYSHNGAQFFGIPNLTKKSHPLERQLAKTATLGAGYGCGGPRFTATVWADTQVPMNIRRDFTEERGGLIIQSYRRANPLLCAYGTGLWSQLDSAARNALAQPGMIFQAAAGNIAFGYQGSTLWLRLPSGRTLPHYNAHVDQFGEFWFYRAKNGRMARQKTYGGAWLEICCLGADTLVVTDSGVKKIVDILPSDQVWDGENFVSHGGLVNRGERETVCLEKVRATENHLILCSTRSKNVSMLSCWQSVENVKKSRKFLRQAIRLGHQMRPTQAQNTKCAFLKRQSFLLEIKSGFSLLKGLFYDRGKMTGIVLIFFAHVIAGLRILSCALPFCLSQSKVKKDVFTAACLGALASERSTRISKFLSSSENDFFKPSQELSIGVTTRKRKLTLTTEPEASLSMTNGGTTEENSWNILSRFRGLMIKVSSLIDPIMKKGTNQETCLLSRQKKILKTEETSSHSRRKEVVYDLLDCGPNSRFMIYTPTGRYLLVHNCQSILRDIITGVEAQIEKEIPDAHLILDIYDSVVLLAPEGRAEAVQKHVEEIMCRPISWAPGLVCGGEGYHAERMKK